MSKDKKEEILALALYFTRLYGFDSFSYQDLSNKIGITKASIHYYFKTKEDLAIAICDKLKKDLINVENNVKEIDDFLERIMVLFNYAIEKLSYKDNCAISSLESGYCKLNHEIKIKVNELVNLEIEIIENTLKYGVDEKVLLDNIDIKMEAYTLLSLFKGSILHSRTIDTDLRLSLIEYYIKNKLTITK